MLLGEAAAGGPAGLDGLEFLASDDASADLIDDVAQDGAHGHLDDTRVDDVSSQGEHLGARALLRSELAVPLGTV